MAATPDPHGSDLSWDEVQALPTGELIHVMLCNFDPSSKDQEAYMQSHIYMAAVEELNERLKRAP